MKTRNIYRNNEKMITHGNSFWRQADENGLAGIVGHYENGRIITEDGHSFVNFSCCSYLDLDSHPAVIEGAVTALRRFGILNHCIPRARVQIPAMSELEATLSDLWNAQVITSISANVASSGILPLIASGHFTGCKRPVMVFDKNCHVSLLHLKPICADETQVETCAYQDLNFIEDLCKKNNSVCYICDGADSLGGYAPVKELAALQERYGLFIFYDDSHSLSAVGKRGEGHVRSQLSELDERTMIVVSLHKAFGTSGGAVMMGRRTADEVRMIFRYGGAIGYSQPMNTAAVGASIASAEIHRTSELGRRQAQLNDNIALFDRLVPTSQAGAGYPIRLVDVPEQTVIPAAVELFRSGFYVSPVFFPVIARGRAGLRVMMRAGQTERDISELASIVTKVSAAQPAL